MASAKGIFNLSPRSCFILLISGTYILLTANEFHLNGNCNLWARQIDQGRGMLSGITDREMNIKRYEGTNKGETASHHRLESIQLAQQGAEVFSGAYVLAASNVGFDW